MELTDIFENVHENHSKHVRFQAMWWLPEGREWKEMGVLR